MTHGRLSLGAILVAVISMIGCGGGAIGNTLTSNSTQSSNVPAISSVTPDSAVIASAVTVQVTGSGFDSSSVIMFDGKPASTRLVDSSTVTTSVTADSASQPGDVNVVVANSSTQQSSNSAKFKWVKPLTITTTSLPSAVQGSSYQLTLAASGGKTPYMWAATSGLPVGLSLDSSGKISGIPTSSGSYSVAVSVTDSESPTKTVSATLVLQVTSEPLGVVSANLGNGTVGKNYNGSVSADGGTKPYKWSIPTGSMPAGLSLAADTGVISGTPVASGTSNFTVAVSDSSSPSQKKTATTSIVVVPQLAISSQSLPDGTVGSTYSTSVQATGGTAPYTWSVPSGTLPPGLTIASSTGAISGTPTGPGTFNVVLGVQDAKGASATANFSITIAAVLALQISTAALPNGMEGSPYDAAVAVSGGTPPYTWSISGGSLPSTMALAATTGEISGTPTTSGTFTPTVLVTDAGQKRASKPFSFTIASGVGNTSAPVISNITYTALSSTSVRVMWTTDVVSDSLVTYSDDSGMLWDAAGDASGTTSHSVTITGMRPGTYGGEYNTVRSRAIADAKKITFAPLPAITTLTAAANGGPTFDYGITYTGSHRIVAGNSLYLSMGSFLTNIPSGKSVTYTNTTITGLPPNSTVAITSNDGSYSWTASTATFRRYQDASGYSNMVRLNTSTSTPPGTYTLHFASTNEEASPVSHSSDWVVTVDPVPTFNAGTPASYPPIPCLGNSSKQMDGSSCSFNWQKNMVTDGQKWCTQQGSTGVESGVWYYDGERVYLQIKDYDTANTLTGNSAQWDTCAQQQESVYRPYALGSPSGYKVFPHGLHQDWIRNGDTTSRDAVATLALKGAYSGVFGLPGAPMTRENAYRIHAELLYAKVADNSRIQYLRDNVEIALGRVDQWTNNNSPWIQPFMVGLWAEALIECYEDSVCPQYQDARIPVAVKTMADWMWANAWATGVVNCGDAGSAYYNIGKPASYGCFYYNSHDVAIGKPRVGAGSDLRNLNLLIVPMYGWLFKMTGDQSYQVIGDTIWQSGVNGDDGAGGNYTGKNFSQQYRWSPDYVAWRSRP